MYARVTRVKFDPARTDAVVEQLKSQMLPLFEQQRGYLGTISIANRETGEGATTTFWDTLENLKASEPEVFAARDKFAAEQATEILSFHRCEVAVAERKADPKAGAHLRVVTLRGAGASKLEALAKRFREEVAPVALAQPGGRSATLMIDRENEIAFGISAYDTASDRDAAGAALNPKRDVVVRELGLEAETEHAETTYADLKAPVQA